jgi:type VI secretion system protein ImpK
VESAKYAVAATIDDLVMSKPWGGAGNWEGQKLVSALYSEVIGGERFFELLEEAEHYPDRAGDLVEFMYICLALGFEGAYRMPGRTARSGLDTQRARAHDSIRQRRAGFASALSPHWRGSDAARRPLREIVPLWLAGALSLAATAAAYAAAVFLIGGQTARAVDAASALTPVGEVEIVALEAPAERPPPPPPPPQAERVEAFLAPEIADRVVEVEVAGGQTRIRLVSTGMFASGRATLQTQYRPVLDRVAEALNREPGRVLVEGHSDAEPISTARFPSNYHLSEARAQAVAAYLEQLLDAPGRLDVMGFGDTALLDPANPRSGVNRRVELVLDRPVE